MESLALNGKSTYASVAPLGPRIDSSRHPERLSGAKNGEWPQIAEEFKRQQGKR